MIEAILDIIMAKGYNIDITYDICSIYGYNETLPHLVVADPGQHLRPQGQYTPSARAGHFACVVKDQIYVISGYMKQESKYETTSFFIEIYDPHSETWYQRRATGTPPPGFYNGACASLNGKIYTYGGYARPSSAGAGAFSDTLSELDTKTLIWKNLTSNVDPNLSPMKKRAAGLVRFGRDKLALIGGYGIRKEPQTDSKSSFFFNKTQGDEDYGWTNEFHTFDIRTGIIASGTLTGNNFRTACNNNY